MEAVVRAGPSDWPLTFDQQRHEGDDGRLQLGHGQTVGPMVPGRVLWKQSHCSEISQLRVKWTHHSHGQGGWLCHPSIRQ